MRFLLELRGHDRELFRPQNAEINRKNSQYDEQREQRKQRNVAHDEFLPRVVRLRSVLARGFGDDVVRHGGTPYGLSEGATLV